MCNPFFYRVESDTITRYDVGSVCNHQSQPFKVMMQHKLTIDFAIKKKLLAKTS